MTAMRRAMHAYGQAVETIPAGKQIVMLYDGILRHIGKARTAIAERRVNDRYMAVQKATTIIEALQGCLDFDKGGEIAPQLDRLYTYFVFRLQQINIQDDPLICDELSARIGELRDSWATIAHSGTPTAEAPVPSERPATTSAYTA